MEKKSLAVVLTLVMLLGLFPATALADEPGTEEPVYEVIDLGTIETSADPGFGISLFDASSGSVDLTGASAVDWIDRVILPADIKTFYNALVSASDNSGTDDWLIDPQNATGTKSIETGTDTYTCVEVTTVPTTQEEYLKKCIRAAYDAFDRDHPEVFWLTGDTMVLSSTLGGNTTFYFSLYGERKNDSNTVVSDIRNTTLYADAQAIKNAITQRNNDINKIMGSGYPSDGTDTEKVEYFDNWLTTNNEYNTNLGSAPKSAWECVSALAGSIGANGPVCEGYARALKVLCDQAKISCVLVDGNASASGTGGEAHMWNYVQIGDTWYGVDTTWNDPTGGSSGAVSSYERQDYLFVGNSTLNTNKVTFGNSHPASNQASPGGVAFTNGPALSENALVKGISVTKVPNTTTYTVGESFDPTGMELTATYWYTTTKNTQATSTISDDYQTAGVTWIPKTFNSTSNTTVTITYGGQTTTQTVTVNNVSSAMNIGTLSNGTITASVESTPVTSGSNVESGKTVTLTVTPDANYELVAGSLKVEGLGNEVVNVSGSGDTYTFTMPAYAVTVKAKFQQQATAAPQFSTNETTLTSAGDKEATFTLSSAPANTTYKVYEAQTGGSEASDVAAAASGNTLTLTLPTAPTTDTTYYISATEAGKAESTRIAVTVKAYAKSTDATLSDLTITDGTLSPSFTSDTTSYTVDVPYSVNSVTVTPTVHDTDKATVTVNGESVTSGSASGAIALTDGQVTAITVVVTAEDGATTETYTINVTRAAAQHKIELDKTGTHVFDSLAEGYQESSLTALTVTVTNTGDVATGELTVALSDTNAGSFSLTDTTISSIGANGNIATFTVKPNTGLTKGTYTATVTVSNSDNGISASFDVSFTVAASQDEVDVNNAKTAIESAGASTWTVAQADANTESDVKTALVEKIESVISSAGITVTADNIAVTGFTPAEAGTSGNHAGTNGSFGFTVTLTKSNATTAATVSGCTITATAYVPSTVATLDSLILSEGTLDPTFNSSTPGYNATVQDTTGSITVTPTLTDAKASVTVNGTAVASGSASGAIPLNVGANTITVVVTAEDGTTTKTYTVTVTRPKPAYGVTLDVPKFADVVEGYTAPGRITVTVTNVGSNATGELTVTLGDTDASSFSVNPESLASIDANGNITFTVATATSLTVGTYTATVTVSNKNITSTADISFTVTPKVTTHTITFNANGGTVTPASATTTAADTLSSLPTPTRSGYRFDGWYTMLTGGNLVNTTTVFGSDSTIYARWTYIGGSTGGGSSSGGSSSGGSSSSGGTTTTDRNPDGSTTTTVTSPNGTVTETTRYPDGSKEVVETKKDGTVTTTTTDISGNKTTVVENPSGSMETTISNKDGSSSTTTVSRSGQVTAEVKIPASVVEDAGRQAVALPMPEVPVTSSRTDAPIVTVDLPRGSSAKVEIPVEDVTPGTVAILVKADGTEEIIKTSVTTADGVAVTLSDGDSVKIVENSKDFYDVSSTYWAADSIDFATSRELFAGTTETTFNPGGTMTRAMIWTVLARLDGVDTTNTGSGAWYGPGLAWASNNGISDGSNPNGYVSRQQLVTLLYRYALQNGYDTNAQEDLSAFSDHASLESYSANAMAWAVAEGIIGGMGNGTLNPNGNASRAQVAAILQRFVNTFN